MGAHGAPYLSPTSSQSAAAAAAAGLTVAGSASGAGGGGGAGSDNGALSSPNSVTNASEANSPTGQSSSSKSKARNAKARSAAQMSPWYVQLTIIALMYQLLFVHCLDSFRVTRPQLIYLSKINSEIILLLINH